MITGLHHVGLSVLNLDAAIDFYTKQHAYNLSHRFDVEDNANNRAMLQLDNASARGAFLQGSLGCLELFEYACKPEMDQEDKEAPQGTTFSPGSCDANLGDVFLAKCIIGEY